MSLLFPRFLSLRALTDCLTKTGQFLPFTCQRLTRKTCSAFLHMVEVSLLFQEAKSGQCTTSTTGLELCLRKFFFNLKSRFDSGNLEEVAYWEAHSIF